MRAGFNPFIVGGAIDPEYFCDRKEESEKLIRTVTSGNNMVLISPRRMGKTGLIQYCFGRPELKDAYRTFYIDILSTTSLAEFILLLGREVYRRLQPLGAKGVAKFMASMQSIAGSFGFDPVSGMPTFNLQLGDIHHPEYTLNEIFSYLASSDKPCIVAIDEFQQVMNYPEGNVEALLRSHIQRLSNANFIFAGSERHMLREMFMESARPFYLSATIMELGPIAEDVYSDFTESLFNKFGKRVDKEIVDKVYGLFDGHTFYLQRTFNNAFTLTAEGGCCTLETVELAITDMLNSNATIYREILSNIPAKQKKLLLAIAMNGRVEAITSAQFITANGLQTASSVQNSIKQLLKSDIVSKNSGYSITDPLLCIWIRSEYGPEPFNLF